MPQPNLTVIITGRTFCRFKNRRLEALFIEVDHQTRLITTIMKDGSTDLETTYSLPQSKISFTKLNVASLSPPKEPEQNINKIMNINSLHGERLQLKDLSISGSQAPDLSYLSLSDANCYTQSSTEFNHEVLRYNYPDETSIYASKIGNSIGANYLIQSGGYFRVKAYNLDGTPAMQELNFPYDPDVTYVIKVDNSCVRRPGEECPEDFHQNYLILEGNGTEIRVRKEVPKTLEAACNPVLGDPDCNLELYYANGGTCPH